MLKTQQIALLQTFLLFNESVLDLRNDQEVKEYFQSEEFCLRFCQKDHQQVTKIDSILWDYVLKLSRDK